MLWITLMTKQKQVCSVMSQGILVAGGYTNKFIHDSRLIVHDGLVW